MSMIRRWDIVIDVGELLLEAGVVKEVVWE